MKNGNEKEKGKRKNSKKGSCGKMVLEGLVFFG